MKINDMCIFAINLLYDIVKSNDLTKENGIKN